MDPPQRGFRTFYRGRLLNRPTQYTRRDSNPDCWFRRPKCYPLHYGCVVTRRANTRWCLSNLRELLSRTRKAISSDLLRRLALASIHQFTLGSNLGATTATPRKTQIADFRSPFLQRKQKWRAGWLQIPPNRLYDVVGNRMGRVGVVD